jgi:glycosyltransferase involved in cell wall biosynthesis
VLRAEPHALFLWLGDGPLKPELRSQIIAQQLGKNVRLLGTRKDAALFFQAADLLVMPSHFEGMPLVLLEAMTAGLPIVATQVGGNPEVIEDQVHGRLVPPSNPQALADAIVGAFANPQQTEQWRIAAQQRFEQCFTAVHMANRVDDLYQRLLRHAKPRREQIISVEPLVRISTHMNGDRFANVQVAQ